MTDWIEIGKQIFELVLIPLLGILTVWLVNIIKIKASQISENAQNELTKKYIELLANTISDCVVATNQTYVDNLKGENIFDADAQKQAFQHTYNAVMAILSDEAKKYLENIYGDLNTYITEKIEAEVNKNKI